MIMIDSFEDVVFVWVQTRSMLFWVAALTGDLFLFAAFGPEEKPIGTGGWQL